jgi:glutathione S-transferase
MELYFSPLACSMATRIAFYEAGADARFHLVDLHAKRSEHGWDFLAINPMGQVPVLRTDAGELLTENQLLLQYVADSYPDAGLAPAGGMQRFRLQQWLSFIATEIHKLVFNALLDPASTRAARAYARTIVSARFGQLAKHLDGREYLLDRFSVADAYLVTVLNWTPAVGLDLDEWPALRAYFARVTQRPSVAKALSEEGRLYAEERAKRAAS